MEGGSLYYEEKGTGATSLFVHGIPTDYRAWSAQMEPFSRTRRAVSLSRRLAAPNRWEGDPGLSTVENNANDLQAFIERACGGRVDLVGHSYGGFAAAWLAASHPDMVRSLILVEPAVSTLLVADQSNMLQLLALLLRDPAVALAARRFQRESLLPSLSALESGELRRAVELNVDGIQGAKGSFARMSENTREMMLENVRTIAELKTRFPRFTSADAKRISIPTLLVNGEASPLWLRKIGTLLSDSVPGAESVRVPGARHFPHMENSDFFNEKVLAFLAKQK